MEEQNMLRVSQPLLVHFHILGRKILITPSSISRVKLKARSAKSDPSQMLVRPAYHFMQTLYQKTC